MSIINPMFRVPRCQLSAQAYRFFSSKADSPSSSNTVNADVAGLSSKVLNVPSGEVGPGASKSSKYKNPEYFSYHKESYFDAEMEMLKYRQPQPSTRSK